MAKKMSISFKEKEIYMYEYLQNKINAAVYIKELILKDMEEKEVAKNEVKVRPREERKNLMDFEV